MSSFSFKNLFKKDQDEQRKDIDTSDTINSSLAIDSDNSSISTEGSPSNSGASETDFTLIAVLSAAVAAILSEGSSNSAPYPGFIVRRIRRLR